MLVHTCSCMWGVAMAILTLAMMTTRSMKITSTTRVTLRILSLTMRMI